LTATARSLAELHAAPILIVAALDGFIATVACSMPVCLCPEGRAYFERRGDPRNGRWAPSADRFPVAGRDGGEYVTANVRLAHKRCNQSEGGRYGGNRGAAALTYEQRAAGGRAAVHFANEKLATPEGRAQRIRCGKIGGAKVSAARKASGQYQSTEHRAGGRRLGIEHGTSALRAWERTDAAHEVRVANGHKLAEWVASRRETNS